MNNISKIFITFIFAVFISLPVWAVTMNGCETTAMQGCSSAVVVVPGPTAPFIINDDMSASPAGWTLDADTVITGGELVSTRTTTQNAKAFDDNGDSPATERWMEYDWTVTSQTMSTSDTIQGSGICQNTANEAVLLGLNYDVGQVKFAVTTRNDAGTKTVTVIDPAVATYADATTYHVVMQYKVATGPGNNDGIAKVWIDNVLVHSDTAIDSDTLILLRNYLGIRSSGGTFAMTQTFDNYKLSLTGQP